MNFEERLSELQEEFTIVSDTLLTDTLHFVVLQRKSDNAVFDLNVSEIYTLEREGVEYDEAMDPHGSGRIYTETTNTKDIEEASGDFSQKASTAYEKGVCDA